MRARALRSTPGWCLRSLNALAVTLVAACGTATPQVVEVTRVVVEREEVEVPVQVEVTRVVKVEVTSEATAPAATPAAGECCAVYRIGILEDPLTTNFWNYLGPGNSVWTAAILHDQAGALYALSDRRFDFVPSLAKGLPPEPVQEGDFYTITVEMVADATWSDGASITAHDVVFTLTTCIELQLTGSWPTQCYPGVLDHVESLDDYIVKFYFNDIPGLAVWQYGVAQAPILPEHFWSEVVAEARRAIEGLDPPTDCGPAGSESEDCLAYENARRTLYEAPAEDVPVAGGYTIDKFQPGAFVQRTANDRYYFKGAEVIEYGDGTWVMELPNGVRHQLYGNASGEETLRITVGPHSPQVIFWIYSSQDAAFQALAGGEIDHLLNPPNLGPGLREQAAQAADVDLHVNEENSLYYLAFNLRKAPMSLPEFRQAVEIIIDKEFLADNVLQGTIIPAYSIVPPGNGFWYNAGIELPPVGLSREERVNRAVSVLQEAGWRWEVEPVWNEYRQDVEPGAGLRMPNGRLVPELILLGPGIYDPRRATFNLWIAEWMRELGIPVQSELTGLNDIIDAVFVQADFDMYILGWSLWMYPDYLVKFFHSRYDTALTGSYNTTGLNDAEYDVLADRFLAATDIEEAQAFAYQLQEMLADRRPYLPLFMQPVVDLVRSDVRLPYTDTLDGIAAAAGFQTNAQVLSK